MARLGSRQGCTLAQQTEAPRPSMETCALEQSVGQTPVAPLRGIQPRPSACSDNQIAFAPLLMARLYPGASPILMGLCCASFHQRREHPTRIGFQNKRHNSSYCGFNCQTVRVLMTKNTEKPDRTCFPIRSSHTTSRP